MTLVLFTILCFLPTFVVSVVLTRFMIAWAPQLGLVDQPAERKVHTTPTPLGGGVAVVLSVIITFACAHIVVWLMIQGWLDQSWLTEELAVHLDGAQYRATQMWSILAAALLLAITGLVDDLIPVAWPFRLAVQFLVAGAIIAAGVQGSLFVTYPWVGQLLTIIWLVVLINSFNFLDNMDGLTGGIGLICSLMFAIIMLMMLDHPRWLVGGMLLILSGSIAGFLVWNWTPARIFMGDAGSTFIGLMVGCMTVLGTFYSSSQADTHVMLAPLCILAIPLYDFTSVLVIRLKRGLSPFHPDKNHFSHRLTDMGLSRKNAVLTVHLATLTTGLGGLILYRVPDWGSAWLIIALIFCVLSIVAILERTGQLAARSRQTGDENET